MPTRTGLFAGPGQGACKSAAETRVFFEKIVFGRHTVTFHDQDVAALIFIQALHFIQSPTGAQGPIGLRRLA